MSEEAELDISKRLPAFSMRAIPPTEQRKLKREGGHGETESDRLYRLEVEHEAERALDTHLAAQGLYLNAMGTLIQFNAIMVGIGCATLANVTETSLKAAVTASLVVHAIAGLRLCWAVRPDDFGPSKNETGARNRAGEDTFKNYKKGWGLTMFGVVISLAGLTLFVAHVFGLKV